MWSAISAIASGIVKPLFDIIDKAVADKDLAAKLKSELEHVVLQNAAKELEAQKDIIVAEASGESWLQRNWRPLIMMMFGGVIFNNYILAAYGIGQHIDIPVDLWGAIKLGLGGYVVGRSAEKVAKTVAPHIKWNGPRVPPK